MTEGQNKKEQNGILPGGACLAYLGDAVFEVLVREHLLETGISDVGRLNELALSYVRATAQSRAIEALLPYLTEEETSDYKRGRNGAGAHPKSASVVEYRRATGLEALFGALWLRGETARARELFARYCAVCESPQGEDETT